MFRGQAGPGESEEPSYTFWKQGIPADTSRRLQVRVLSSLQDSHLAQLVRARNVHFCRWLHSHRIVEDKSYFSLLSSGSQVQVLQWLQFINILLKFINV